MYICPEQSEIKPTLFVRIWTRFPFRKKAMPHMPASTMAICTLAATMAIWPSFWGSLEPWRIKPWKRIFFCSFSPPKKISGARNWSATRACCGNIKWTPSLACTSSPRYRKGWSPTRRVPWWQPMPKWMWMWSVKAATAPCRTRPKTAWWLQPNFCWPIRPSFPEASIPWKPLSSALEN